MAEEGLIDGSFPCPCVPFFLEPVFLIKDGAITELIQVVVGF